jgi:hypothetical protein
MAKTNPLLPRTAMFGDGLRQGQPVGCAASLRTCGAWCAKLRFAHPTRTEATQPVGCAASLRTCGAWCAKLRFAHPYPHPRQPSLRGDPQAAVRAKPTLSVQPAPRTLTCPSVPFLPTSSRIAPAAMQ